MLIDDLVAKKIGEMFKSMNFWGGFIFGAVIFTIIIGQLFKSGIL